MTIRGLGKKLNRRRHRLGFGVHSPFAFRLINDVVRGKKCHYYDSAALWSETHRFPRQLRRECRMLFRLVARHNVRCAVLLSETDSAFESALLLAAPSLEICRDLICDSTKLTLIVADAEKVQLEKVRPMLSLSNIIYIRDLARFPQLIKQVEELMPGGWILSDGKSLLAVPDPVTPLNRIDVKLI